MSTHRYFDKICIAVMVFALMLTVLFMNGEKLGIQTVSAAEEEVAGTEYFTARDLDGDWDTSQATVISLEGDSARIKGQGAYAGNGNVYITGAGYYVITGTLDDGSIIVDAYQTSDVWILFDNVSITCSDDAALQVDQADNLFLTLKEGTVNTLTSGAEYTTEAINDGSGGVIYAHDDLTINGSGSLIITGEYKHGIECNDELLLTGGQITIDVPGDGLHVNDSIRISNTDLTINAGDDAIHCDMEIIVVDGNILIESCYEGLEAPQITVLDGSITIYPEDDGFNANGGTDLFGAMGYHTVSDTDTGAAATDVSTDEQPWINISGGEITIINENGRDADGLDSNGDIYISGGTVLISVTDSGSNSAIDYGSESGGVCEISGGTVIACGSSSMAEAFSSSSTQCAILYNPDSSAEAGTMFEVLDDAGNVLISWEVPCSFSSVNVSIPELSVGSTYTLTVGETSETLTLEETVTADGAAAGMCGMGAMGGMGGGFGHHAAADGTDGTQTMGGGFSRPGRGMQSEGTDSAESTGTRPDFAGMEPP
ncbi:MAG: carbohydrate-binding domain-containing protein, partial [Lachnospiraceae bacterium]|nr:carbohydrate-binding domain-containing protein [Lachnospiraceae bacterium]